MNLPLRIQRSLAVAVLVALLVWPMAHMVLCKKYGFSSWRYGGFGMFATPQRSLFSSIKVYLRDQPVSATNDELAKSKQPAQISLGKYALEVYRIGENSGENAFLWTSDRRELETFLELTVGVLNHRRKREIVRFASETFRLNHSQGSRNQAVVTFADLRVDLSDGMTYSDVHVYTCDQDVCTYRGSYSNKDTDIGTVLNGLFAEFFEHR
jgi:hypothetical protein